MDDELAVPDIHSCVIRWAPTDGCFIASAPDLPGLEGTGDSRAAALAAMEHALASEEAPPPGEAFHQAACLALGIDPGRGSQLEISTRLGVSQARYSGVRRGKAAGAAVLAKWSAHLGLSMHVYPTGVMRFGIF